METRGYADGVTVNEYKLLDFLSIRLMQGNKQKGKNFGKPLSASSLRGCMIFTMYFPSMTVSVMAAYCYRSKRIKG